MKTVILSIFLLISSYCYSQDIAKHKQDTLKVIMLYCDTALTEMIGYDPFGDEYEFLGIDEQCYWRIGYRVGDNYLDIDKVKIPDSNIVWFTKIIK